ncbi:hypothetical protein RA262_28475, partial [Pseudomonas syringae pv. tagetis]
MRTAQRADGGFVGAGQLCQARVGEASALQLAQACGVQRVDATGSDFAFCSDDFLDLVQEPVVDERQCVDLFHAHA